MRREAEANHSWNLANRNRVRVAGPWGARDGVNAILQGRYFFGSQGTCLCRLPGCRFFCLDIIFYTNSHRSLPVFLQQEMGCESSKPENDRDSSVMGTQGDAADEVNGGVVVFSGHRKF